MSGKLHILRAAKDAKQGNRRGAHASSGGPLKHHRYCTVDPDRIGFVCDDCPLHERLTALGFERLYDRLVRQKGKRPKPYARVCRYAHQQLNSQIEVAYQPLSPWIPGCRVVLVANDKTGVSRTEADAILPTLENPRLILVELAVDFDKAAGVDRNFVLNHARFGKSQLRLLRRFPDTLWFGSRRSTKFVRGYPKPGVADFRIELELHTGFLRKYSIGTIADMHRLPDILFPDHMFFARINRESFERFASGHVRHAGPILRVVKSNCKSLGRTLQVLRSEFGLKNLHRHLDALPINEMVMRALQRWGRRWKNEGSR